jgi:hypothetical protein
MAAYHGRQIRFAGLRMFSLVADADARTGARVAGDYPEVSRGRAQAGRSKESCGRPGLRSEAEGREDGHGLRLTPATAKGRRGFGNVGVGGSSCDFGITFSSPELQSQRPVSVSLRPQKLL